jgi:SAM-dependent methyltransferase
MLELTPSQRALDIACGSGTSAILLARQFGCAVVGVDLAPLLIARARSAASREKPEGVLSFALGDAEALPFSDGSFDAVFSECAISTFPDKLASAREMARVLKDVGRLGFTDIVLTCGEIPEEFQGWFSQAACIAGACSVGQYEEIFTSVGLSDWREEAHPESLITLLREVRARLLALEVAGGIGKLDLSGVDLSLAKKVLGELEESVRSGMVTYCAFSAVKEA